VRFQQIHVTLSKQSDFEDVAQISQGIVSKPVQKLVGKLTLFQGISQVLRHHKTT